MGRDTTIKATIDIGAKIDQFQSGIKQIQDSLNKIAVPDNVRQSFTNIFQNVEKEVQNIQKLTGSGQISLVDVKSVSKSFGNIEGLYRSLIKRLESEKVSTSFLKEDAEVISKLRGEVKKYEDSVRNASAEWKRQKNELDQIVQTRREEKRIADAAVTAAKNEGKLKVQSAKDTVANLKAESVELEKQTKQVKTRFETEEEFRKRWLTKHDNLRGAKQSYEASQKKGTLQQVEDPVATDKAQAEARAALAEKTREVAVAEEALAKAKNYQGTDQYQELVKNAQAAQEALDAARKNVDDFKLSEQNISGEAFKKIAESIQNMKGIDWTKYGVDPSTIKSVDDLNRVITQVAGSSTQQAQAILQTANQTLIETKTAGDEAREGFEQAATGVKELGSTQSDIERLTTRLVQFFSIDNAVRLFKRAVRSAMSTIQDLDKVMTETAVVTEFSVADMWKQLPEYTKRANELGLAVRDVYEASTLYYQQGLETNEVMAVTNATLRMARIASLDAADATDRMTNALRGFNMEIDESNADNVADVYSKLAAISASNVDEISTAMTKVASLANSANMSFENTAAFLSQIIETTRESAETAGTALKTVVARFSEVKNLYSKGELLGTDEEGEEIDVNKVSKALRTAGINLNEFLTGQRGLDEIFMELASKWDDLDIVQQRYIATMAAGSRQQSRFIALMSDYKRTQELTTAAQNASGASMEQYEKTLESIETKVNRLKNAWNEFLMGIANDQFIRGALDTLTNILQGINKLTDGISGGNGLLKSIANLSVAIGGLKIGKSVVRTLLGDPKTQSQGWITQFLLGSKKQSTEFTQAGFKAGKYYSDGFFNSVKKSNGLKDAFKYTFKPKMTAGELGLKTIDFNDINLKINKNLNSNVFGEMLMGIDPNSLTVEQQDKLASIQQKWQMDSVEGTAKVQELSKELKEAGIQATLTGEQADKMGVKFRNTTGSINAMSIAATSIGGVLLSLATWFEKLAGTQTPLTKGLKATGAALIAFGSILPIISKQTWLFAGEMTAAIDSIPIIGWIAAVVSALIGLGVAIADAIDSPKEAAEKAKTILEDATEQANNATDAVDNLASSYSELVDNADKLDELTKGTKEWEQAVRKNNEAVLDLLSNYKELNVVSRGGILEITNYDDVMDMYAQRAQYAQIGVMGASINSLQKDLENSMDIALKKAGNMSFQTGGLDTYEKKQQLALAAANGTIDDFYATYAKLTNQTGIANEDTIQNEEIYQIFRSLGQDILDTNETINSWSTSLATATVEQARLTEEQKRYSDSLVSNTTAMDGAIKNSAKWFNGFLGMGRVGIGGVSKDDRLLYEKYIHETYGDTVEVNWRGAASSKNDGTNDIQWETESPKFQAWKAATGEYTKDLQKQTAYLVKLSKTNDEYNKSLAKSYEGINGELLTSEDLNNIQDKIGQEFSKGFKNFEITDLQDTTSSLYTSLYKYYTDNKELSDAFGGDNGFVAWAEAFINNLLQARDRVDQAYGQLTNETFQQLTGNVSSNILETFANAITQYAPTDRGEFATKIIDALGLTGGELESALKELSTIDWTNLKELNELQTKFKSLDLTIPENKFDNFVNLIKERVGSLNKLDFSNFKENLSTIQKAIQDFNSGEIGRVIESDTYNAIKEYVDQSQFQETDYGVIYTGQDTASLGTNITNAVVEGLTNENKILGAKIAVAENYDYAKAQAEAVASSVEAAWQRQYAPLIATGEVSEDDIKASANANAERMRLITMVDAIVQTLGEDIYNLSEVSGLVDAAQYGASALNTNILQDIVDQFFTFREEQEQNESQDASNIISAMVFGGMDEIIANWGDAFAEAAFNQLTTTWNLPEVLKQQYIEIFNDPSLTEAIRTQLAAQVEELGKIYSDAEYWGIDSELLQNTGENYSEIYGLAADTASRLALENLNLNTGLEAIVSSYDQWNELLENSITDETLQRAAEYQEVISNLEKNIRQMFSIKGNLSFDFMNSKDTKQLLQAAATGDLDAITTLGRNAAADIKSQFNFNSKEQVQSAKKANAAAQKAMENNPIIIPLQSEIDEESFAEVENQLFAALDAIDPNLEIDAYVNNESLANAEQGIIDMMNDMLINGHITAEQMQDYFSSIGYTPDVTWIEEEVPMTHHGDYHLTDSNGNTSDFTYSYTDYTKTKIPQIQDIHYNGPPAQVISPSTRNTMAQNAAPKSSGSSGSDSKPNLWKNPYDELYNLQQKINEALREREKLEHRYEDMLKDHTKTASNLVENTLMETAALKKQLQLEKEMLAGRKDQTTRVLNEMFEDSEGNRTTLGAMGVARYASYDQSRNLIQIDWNAIDQIVDENLGNAVEQYISRLEELQGQINDTEDTIEEINDTLIEIKDRGKEEYLDFEQKVYDAIVQRREAEIATLEAVSSAISDAANKTVSSIQDEISKEREARENDKAEQDLLDKQMRLSYLQRDTSGANDLEILKLQQEIENDQQAYQDRLIDQTIQEMQDEATRAEEQRQAQIDILNAQLEQDQKLGFIWDNVQTYLKGGFDAEGRLKVNSELDKLLQEGENFRGLSEFGKLQWKEDVAKEVAIALQGLHSYHMTAAENAGSMTLANGTKLSYDRKNDRWLDANGNEYTDFKWDQSKEAFTATAKTAPVTSSSSSSATSTTTTSASEPTGDDTYTVRNGDTLWAIATRYFGNGAQAYNLARYNGIANADLIYTGQVIRIPKSRHFATGGIADFTGPAWLDGTKSRPEMVLNAADTQNFIALKDILARILNNTSNGQKPIAGGDNYFDINIEAQIDSDYDVDQLADRIKKQITDDAMYRNVNVISQMR